jgi:hypothetical protein
MRRDMETSVEGLCLVTAHRRAYVYADQSEFVVWPSFFSFFLRKRSLAFWDAYK